jgi:hypothetical protein
MALRGRRVIGRAPSKRQRGKDRQVCTSIQDPFLAVPGEHHRSRREAAQLLDLGDTTIPLPSQCDDPVQLYMDCPTLLVCRRIAHLPVGANLAIAAVGYA